MERQAKTEAAALDQRLVSTIKSLEPDQLQRLGFDSHEQLLNRLAQFKSSLQDLKKERTLKIELIMQDRVSSLIELSKDTPYEDKAGTSLSGSFGSKETRDAVLKAWNEQFKDYGLRIVEAPAKTDFGVSKTRFGYVLQPRLRFEFDDEFWSDMEKPKPIGECIGEKTMVSLEETLRRANTRFASLTARTDEGILIPNQRDGLIDRESARRMIRNMKDASLDPSFRTSYIKTGSIERAEIYRDELTKWAKNRNFTIRTEGAYIIFERKFDWEKHPEVAQKIKGDEMRKSYEGLIQQISTALIQSEIGSESPPSQKIGGGVGVKAAAEIIAKVEEARISGETVTINVNPDAASICQREINNWLMKNYPGMTVALKGEGQLELRKAAA
jgi:hypothetical protein